MSDRVPADSAVRRRPGGRSAVVRQAVYAATLELLAETGYRDLQLPEVASRAGVHKTTVYRWWPTKAHLVSDLMKDVSADQVPTPDTGSLHGDLVVFLADVAAMIDQPAVKAVIQAGIPQPGDSAESVASRDAYWDERFAHSSAIVRRAVVRGELHLATDPRLFLEYASSPIYFRRLITGEPVSPEFIEQLARDTARAFAP